MANFENGVSGYVHATATVSVLFPIDHKGNADVCCRQCYYYRPSNFRCALNGEVCHEPNKYISGHCPLNFEEEE